MKAVLTELSGSVEGIQVASGFEDPKNSSFFGFVVVAQFVSTNEAALNAAEHPILAAIWDNEDDAAYDEL